MNNLTIIFFLLFSAISINSFAQSKENKEKALEYGKEAIKKIDNGEYKEALKLLGKAQKLDPKNYVYPYEVAYTYYKQKNYKKVITELEKQIKRSDVTEQHFQLLGNSYDLIEKPDKALEAYQRGLQHFPKSGKLYLEQGIVEMRREKFDKAIAYWEKGVEVEPTFSSNYYWLGKIFASSSERIWGVLYGELFINLERNSRRTVEMSELLFETYKKSIDISSDTSGGVFFSRVMTMVPGEKFENPFQMDFGMTMTLGLTPILLGGADKELSIKVICQLRESFIQLWFQNKHHKKHPNVLFDFHKKLKDKGFFEAYSYWILMKGNEEEFLNWHKENEPQFDDFANWFNDNPISISNKNYFSRIKE